MKKVHGELIIKKAKSVCPNLFEVDPMEEITKIIFESNKDVLSPRLYSNVSYQSLLVLKLDLIFGYSESRSYNETEFSINTQTRNNIFKSKRMANKVLKPADSMAISDELNVITYANSRPKRNSSRNPTSITKNSRDK